MALLFAILFLIRADALQSPGVLHIKVVVLNSERQPTPVTRHALLISDNPSSAPPRRILTATDGSVDLHLAPGNYTVESDRPLAFEGKAYQWTEIVDIVTGRDTTLILNEGNAAIEALPAGSAATTTAAEPMKIDTSTLLRRWEEGVLAIWTPTAHGSASLINANGMLVTSQRVVGVATSVEVQLTDSVKVTGTVVVADAARDVAVVRIDPSLVAKLPAVPLACGQTPPTIAEGQELYALEAPMTRNKGTISGTVRRLAAKAIESDLAPASGGEGGPVFTEGGAVVGLVSIVDEDDNRRAVRTPVVRVSDICSVVAAAETKTKDVPAPSAAPLPMEPDKPFPVDPRTGSMPRGGSYNPYQISATDFDIAFITPLQVESAENRSFSNWSEYVADRPSVLLVRATPKMVEGFWTKVGRGAAMTQGVALPAFKHPKSGFSRMRAYCGETEVTPIHPFRIDQRVSPTEAVYEGLYVFDPGAFPPECGTVKLILYSEKEPDKADTKVVDPKVVEQIWKDFAPYRAIK